MSAGTHASRVVLCRLDDVPVGGMRRVLAPGIEPLAVFRLPDGVHVTSDTCTHADESLTEGDLDDATVICPAHFGEFDVRTGRALCFPAERPLTVYPARVDGEHVVIGTDGPE